MLELPAIITDWSIYPKRNLKKLLRGFRESEWLFGTPAGRRQLQDSARFGRLVVAVLRRGHHFESLDAVKEELAHAAKMLIPYGFVGQVL